MLIDLNIDYLSQTQLYRPGRKEIDTAFCSRSWRPSIDRLLAAGYSFLPCRYEEDGYLFRGMPSAIKRAMRAGEFGHFQDDDEMCRVERAMGVYFFTNEISDAVTVSRLYEASHDGGIIAVRSSVFNERLSRHAAAVLAVGDGGIVFRYPFFSAPVPAASVAWIFVSPGFDSAAVPHPLHDRIVTVVGNTRKASECNLEERMQEHGIRPAAAVYSQHYPKRE